MTKRWFITGCSTGFGRALAELLLDRGDQVAVTGLTLESVQDIVAKAPDRALGLELDVRNPEQVRSSLDAAWKHFGGIDVLVNNAGYGVQGPLESVTDEQIQNLFATNVFGMMDVIRAALPRQRDFRGLNGKSFDGRGNYTMGLKEHIVFPEIEYDKVDKIRGMDIIVCTTARSDDEARELLREFNFPFRK